MAKLYCCLFKTLNTSLAPVINEPQAVGSGIISDREPKWFEPHFCIKLLLLCDQVRNVNFCMQSDIRSELKRFKSTLKSGGRLLTYSAA